MSAGVILFVAFAACLVIGVPVSISLGVASLCSVVFGGLSASSTVIAQRIFGGLQSTSIMAIAFFVLAGNLMTQRWHLPPYRKFRQLPGRQCARRNEPGTGFSLRILRSLIRFRSCNCYCYRYHALQ